MTKMPKTLYRFGPYSLDPVEQSLFRGGELCELTPKEFHTLLLLVQRTGHVVSKHELKTKVWPDVTITDNNLPQHIAALRSKLGAQEDGQPYIKTVQRVGYRFSAPVTESQELPSRLTPVEKPLTPDNPYASGSSANSFLQGLIGGGLESIGHSEERPGFELRRGLLIGLGTLAVLIAASALSIIAWHYRDRVPARKLEAYTDPSPVSYPDREVSPTFSPGGDQIAYHSSHGVHLNNNIYRRSVLGGASVRLTSGADDDRNPAWSPDGKLIAFDRNWGPHGAIYVMTPEGEHVRRLTSVKGYAIGWFPTSRYLAVLDGPSIDGPLHIDLVEVATGARTTLYQHAVLPDADQIVQFSPDGKYLAFPDGAQLHVLDIDARTSPPVARGSARALTHGVLGFRGFAWMPNSDDMVLSADGEGMPNLWLVSLKSSGIKPLQFEGLRAERPALSTNSFLDGKPRLAYESFDNRASIWRMELSKDRRLLQRPSRVRLSRQLDLAPQFSPDKKSIVFASRRGGVARNYIWHGDDVSLRELPMPGSTSGAPRWSLDGRRIAFDAKANGNWDIYVADVGGSGLRKLTEEPSDEIRPSWSTDGQWIYFCSDRGRERIKNIWRMRSDGSGAAQQITRHGGFEAFESWDGKTIYYVKSQGASGLWKVSSDGGEELPVLDSVTAGHWSVSEDGIYFMYFGTAERSRSVQFFSFKSLRTELICQTHADASTGAAGFAASRDGRSLLVSLLENQTSEIRVVNDFEPRIISSQ